MGFLVDDESTALMWRGLILTKAVEQFLTDVRWGELDYLLVDMPPGTGDVQMGLARMLPQTEMLVVTTPAPNAQKVATRVADMARRSYMKVVGVVENMSEFVAPDGQRFALFGSGGGAALAEEIGAPLVASIPLEPEVSEGGDTGTPVAWARPTARPARRSTTSRRGSSTSCCRRSRWPAAPRGSSSSRPPTSPRPTRRARQVVGPALRVADFTQRLAGLPTFVLVPRLRRDRRRARHPRRHDPALAALQDEARAPRRAGPRAIMLGVLANIYAVLIAFVIVQGWSNLQQAQTYVDAQATALTQIRENTKVLDRTDEAPIDNALDDYARSVLTRRLPVDGGGRHPQPGHHRARSTTCSGAVRLVKPEGHAQIAFYDQTVERLDNIVEARQSAVTASDGSLPGPLYVLLALGGVVVVVLACALDSEHRKSHLIIVVLDRGA